MIANDSTVSGLDTTIENFAAELTEAAFPVALRYGLKGSSVDLELTLWRALTERVKKWRRELPIPVGSSSKVRPLCVPAQRS